MFTSAFKSISSTINSGYTVAATPTSAAGPWKIYDAKKKSTGKAYSVFVFDRKSLDAHASSLGRSGAAAFKKVADEVVERLKREASSLARLRHPSILELVEPVEDTRGGGLQFATEAVTASLTSLLQEKDEQEGAHGSSGRSRASRYVTEDADGVRRRREIEIDELEIQKGLLQLGKALEFLHENAGLVHGNLTPDAVLVNAKSDWKISGLAFCGPAEIGAAGPSASFPPVSVHEILNMDARLPKSVQLNLDYASPDLVLDNNLTPSADMFSLGLLCVALYNSPHRSPIEAHASVSSYKRAFASAGGVPSNTNNYLSSRPLPRELAVHVLPRLIARRPAQRLTAKEFQTSEYFDNILVSTIRFLDAFPAKTHGEKSSFMRGLNKVLPSFPKSVMEKKVLPALLDEMKDRELAPQILQNVFRIVELLPSAKRVFSDRVLPCLKEHFLVPGAAAATANHKNTPQERDPSRDASLMVVLDRLVIITDNTTGKEFKDDVLPIVATALDSPTPAVVDAALRSVPAMLPVLDFSTIKHELFPVVAAIFSKTSSLAIKIRGLQAFVILCGGSPDSTELGGGDGLDGLSSSEPKRGTSTSTALDKYTMQEKIVPLIKGIKTKEPAVMMEALNVLRVVGGIVDADFVAFELLPVLWTMSLGPLLNLKQFQAFMKLIKTLSSRVEDEQVRKLQELSGADAAAAHSSLNGNAALMDEFSSFGAGIGGSAFDVGGGSGGGGGGGDVEDDFERLVKGKTGGGGLGGDALMDGGWDAAPAASARRPSPNLGGNRSTTPRATASAAASAAPAFSWSTPTPTPTTAQAPPAPKPQQQPAFRTVTPDLNSFAAMTPSSTQFSTALPARPMNPTTTSAGSTAVNSASAWSAMTPSLPTTTSPPATTSGINWGAGSGSGSMNSGNAWSSPAAATSSGFSLSPPPVTGASSAAAKPPSSGFSLPPPPGMGSMASMTPTTTTASTPNYMPNYNRPGLGSMNSMGSMNTMGGMGSVNSMMSSNNKNGVGMGMNSMNSMNSMANANNSNNTNGMMATQPGKTGLDKYESLL
ncbi:SCY1 protein kinase [Sporothrix schenckii ATCC 58251]|uniref:SCY1 protein kinase n=1 Tax=Sporothrix schenckii (strain ATCC 58251 / de Perez 2211183) TaxID=1391915 RepID=U7PTR6_SPOS1|nr:SCY1 protein kinase [Sporothrix schenckii ATCC 58251]